MKKEGPWLTREWGSTTDALGGSDQIENEIAITIVDHNSLPENWR